MIKKASDVKLSVLPLLISVEHLYYYEGPCRFGKGDALQPGYDRLANAQKQEQFLGLLKDHLPEGCEMMEPVTLSRTDDWENPEAQWDAIAPAVAACDIIVAQTGIASAPPPPTAPWTRSTAMSISPIVWAFASGLSTSMRCSTR